VAGLRREEVALLAGVSVDYYTRLERGNLGGVSEAVLDARSSRPRPARLDWPCGLKGDRMRRLGRDANQRWLAYFIPGIVLVVVATPINGLARVLISAVAIVFLLMAVIVGGRQRGT
jgi:hypothetical protein